MNILEGYSNVKMWTGTMDVEESAVKQLQNMSMLPILAGHLAIMPDVHFGLGATIGTVIPTRNAIIPAAVGVDIGCGMCAAKTNLKASDLPESLTALRNQIERDVPVGFNDHGSRGPSIQGPYADFLRQVSKKICQEFEGLAILNNIHRSLSKGLNKVTSQLGTLGGGNHFIEICLDTQDNVWIMLHSGSRGMGNIIGQTAIEMAKDAQEIRKYGIPDKDLSWLDEGTEAFDTYIQAMMWAQKYARINRDVMMQVVIQGIKRKILPTIEVAGEIVNCHHNFTSIEEHFSEKMWVTRKGAVSAKKGEFGIIPGSMGAKSFIVLGKGNEDSYSSCSHGAGRIMSRNQAKKVFTKQDMEEQTLGVECRKDEKVIDEIPGAYKNIDDVMAAQEDLVSIVHTLKQILCVKG